MKDKLTALIANYRLLSEEVFYELNELNQLDLSKFSDKESKDIKDSINELQQEYSMRKDFLSDLEDLL